MSEIATELHANLWQVDMTQPLKVGNWVRLGAVATVAAAAGERAGESGRRGVSW